jgi:hypothetical protein
MIPELVGGDKAKIDNGEDNMVQRMAKTRPKIGG